MLLPRLQRAIELNNNNLIMKYLNIINSSLDGKSKFRLGGENRLRNINKIIEDA